MILCTFTTFALSLNSQKTEMQGFFEQCYNTKKPCLRKAVRCECKEPFKGLKSFCIIYLFIYLFIVSAGMGNSQHPPTGRPNVHPRTNAQAPVWVHDRALLQRKQCYSSKHAETTSNSTIGPLHSLTLSLLYCLPLCDGGFIPAPHRPPLRFQLPGSKISGIWRLE